MNYQELITEEFRGSKLEESIYTAELSELNDIIAACKKAVVYHTKQKQHKQADYYRDAVREGVLKRVAIKS